MSNDLVELCQYRYDRIENAGETRVNLWCMAPMPPRSSIAARALVAVDGQGSQHHPPLYTILPKPDILPVLRT